ncbi:MAG: hypothetical protein U5L45_09585 [Saprospiraceae bacterium]|nr:hypothetical protein [Saprospiraceae bacterium]
MKEKSKIFLSKHARPKEKHLGRFLSEEKKNLSRPSSGASKYLPIIYERLLTIYPQVGFLNVFKLSFVFFSHIC